MTEKLSHSPVSKNTTRTAENKKQEEKFTGFTLPESERGNTENNVRICRELAQKLRQSQTTLKTLTDLSTLYLIPNGVRIPGLMVPTKTLELNPNSPTLPLRFGNNDKGASHQLHSFSCTINNKTYHFCSVPLKDSHQNTGDTKDAPIDPKFFLGLDGLTTPDINTLEIDAKRTIIDYPQEAMVEAKSITSKAIQQTEAARLTEAKKLQEQPHSFENYVNEIVKDGSVNMQEARELRTFMGNMKIPNTNTKTFLLTPDQLKILKASITEPSLKASIPAGVATRISFKQLAQILDAILNVDSKADNNIVLSREQDGRASFERVSKMLTENPTSNELVDIGDLFLFPGGEKISGLKVPLNCLQNSKFLYNMGITVESGERFMNIRFNDSQKAEVVGMKVLICHIGGKRYEFTNLNFDIRSDRDITNQKYIDKKYDTAELQHLAKMERAESYYRSKDTNHAYEEFVAVFSDRPQEKVFQEVQRRYENDKDYHLKLQVFSDCCLEKAKNEVSPTNRMKFLQLAKSILSYSSLPKDENTNDLQRRLSVNMNQCTLEQGSIGNTVATLESKNGNLNEDTGWKIVKNPMGSGKALEKGGRYIMF